MCVHETRRQVHVYRKGRWGLRVCMFARGRVLVIKVSANSCKWLREGGRVISRACVRERHLGRECVSMCERPPMESETTRKRLLYTLIKDINCIQILGWDHDICNSRKERSLIHQTSRFYRIWACLCYYSTQLIHIVSILNSRQCIALAIEYKREYTLQKNTLPWWYVFVTVGRIFCHACTSMMILWQNQDSHTCAVVEVFHDITKIIITEVSTSMTINRASQKCFRQGWPTRGIHRNGTPLSYRVGFWIR